MPRQRRSANALAMTTAPRQEIDQLHMEEFLKDLSVRDAKTVETETREFLNARFEGQRSYLAMGQHLERIQAVLEPAGKFLTFLGYLPNVSQATAYRMIWAWQNAQRVLPDATLQAAMLQGYKLISWQKDGGFTAQYEKAIAKVEREIGPPPAHDLNRAHKWLARVAEVKREMSPKTRVFDPEKGSISLIRGFQRWLGRLPRPERGKAAERLLGQMMRVAEVAQVKPVSLPKTYTMPKRGRPREDVEEDKKRAA